VCVCVFVVLNLVYFYTIVDFSDLCYKSKATTILI